MSGKNRREIKRAKQQIEYSDFICDKALKVLSSDTSAETKNRLLEILRSYIINNNCSLQIASANPISPEHKLLIRDDCNGNISNVNSEYMSKKYIKARRNSHKNDGNMYNIMLYDQALKDSVYWAEMRDYPSYRSIEYPLLVHLIDQKIAPEVIKSMGISDFRDFIKDFCYEEFAKYHEQKGFVKRFIRSNEDEFYELLCSNAVHPEYAAALIENMRTKGNAESFVLNYKGQTITGPGFDVDHKNPVYCPNNIKSYHEVNHPRSLTIIEKNAHRLKHKLERVINIDNDIKMYEKIMLPSYCAAMLNFENYIVYDFDNPKRQIVPQPPHADNLIFLNKIGQFLEYINLESENPRNKTKKQYINKGGRQ
ncbi:MAG: hypothetical protein J6T72_01085 [Alphaproteobacteria bacterium]|nr:hypothetical protein [Alphaproteobacteria bacterium]